LASDLRVLEEIRQFGPREAYRRLIAINDAHIRGPQLDNGCEIAAHRTAIHTEMVAHWADCERERLGYQRPFAVVALGGTGRGEMTPCSDTDFALLFEERTEDSSFLAELLKQTVNGDTFLNTYGFKIWPQPYNLEHVPALTGMQLNSFLDMRAIYDPHDLTCQFRERIRATFDPFEHFLHVSQSWRGASCLPSSACERLDRFDIKLEGLRVFLAGVWTLGGRQFRHSHEVYNSLDDARDLESYYFLLRIRAFIQLRRGTHSEARLDGSHAEDLLGFGDFESFGELLGTDADERGRFVFANQVRARLLAARRRVDRFTRGVIGRELQQGHRTSPDSSVIHGLGGLRHDATQIKSTSANKSAAALTLLLASQKYGVAIDPAELEGTFRNAGDWLLRVPQLSMLFYETRGSLADTIDFLSQIDGAMERLFPGYSNFEASLDERVLKQRVAIRGVWVREKLRALDACLREGWRLLEEEKGDWDPMKALLSDVAVRESVRLNSDHLAAVKLALITKRLPVTAEDATAQQDASVALHERYASGFARIGLQDYFVPYATEAGFSETTVRVAEFLVANRRTFKSFATRGLNDQSVVNELVNICPDIQTLRTLFVFTCVDRLMGVPAQKGDAEDAPIGGMYREWWLHENSSTRWFNTLELYVKGVAKLLPGTAPDAGKTLRAAGFGAREREILEDFGGDFFSGQYVRHTNHFASHLLRLVDNRQAGPKVDLVRDGDALLLGVAAGDFRGLAACIAGSLYKHNVSLTQAHLFSAATYHLALDFFHLAPDQLLPRDLTAVVREAVQGQLHISAADGLSLPPLSGISKLDGMDRGVCCLHHETTNYDSGLLYALTYKVFHELGGSIHGLSAYTQRGCAYISVHLTLPHDRSLQTAQEIVARSWNGKTSAEAAALS
jgi:hypothetical protein